MTAMFESPALGDRTGLVVGWRSRAKCERRPPQGRKESQKVVQLWCVSPAARFRRGLFSPPRRPHRVLLWSGRRDSSPREPHLGKTSYRREPNFPTCSFLRMDASWSAFSA